MCVLSRRTCVCALMCFCVSWPPCCAALQPCWLLRARRRRRNSRPATPHLRRHRRCCPQISCSSTVRPWPCSTSSTATCSPRGATHSTYVFTGLWTCSTRLLNNTHTAASTVAISQTILCCVCVLNFHTHHGCSADVIRPKRVCVDSTAALVGC